MMEKTSGAGVGAGGLEKMLAGLRIRAPRPEDAGLEDCALSPGSIMEAFSRAAGSFRSRTAVPSSDRDGDGDADGCVRDPGPADGDAATDALVGGAHQRPGGPACGGGGAKMGGLGEHDEVVVGGGGADEVVDAADDGGEVEEDDEKPILVEGVL